MSNEEHYFENLLFHGHDIKGNPNKKGLSPEVIQAIETCAQYVLYNIFWGQEDFLKHEDRSEYLKTWKWGDDDD